MSRLKVLISSFQPFRDSRKSEPEYDREKRGGTYKSFFPATAPFSPDPTRLIFPVPFLTHYMRAWNRLNRFHFHIHALGMNSLTSE